MAFGTGTISDIGGAVSDLFGADAARTKSQGDLLKAQGDDYKAQADALKATSDRLKGQGDLAEAGLYDESAAFAEQNSTYTQQSTAIQISQANRTLYQTIGAAKGAIASSGGAESGSALDVLRDSAAQGALHQAVMQQQGLITEAGFDQQAKSYTVMAGAARMASQQDEIAAQIDEKGVQIDQTAASTDRLAASADASAATGMDIGAALKGVAAVASIGLAPFTGGASLALGALGDALIPSGALSGGLT